MVEARMLVDSSWYCGGHSRASYHTVLLRRACICVNQKRVGATLGLQFFSSRLGLHSDNTGPAYGLPCCMRCLDSNFRFWRIRCVGVLCFLGEVTLLPHLLILDFSGVLTMELGMGSF